MDYEPNFGGLLIDSSNIDNCLGLLCTALKRMFALDTIESFGLYNKKF